MFFSCKTRKLYWIIFYQIILYTYLCYYYYYCPKIYITENDFVSSNTNHTSEIDIKSDSVINELDDLYIKSLQLQASLLKHHLDISHSC